MRVPVAARNHFASGAESSAELRGTSLVTGRSMDPFEILRAEHRLIASVLDAFERYLDRLERSEAIPRRDLEEFVVFFREYLDLSHHDKEETILVPALVRHGFHWDEGPLARMRREHDHERYLMRTLRHAALSEGEWSDAERRHAIAIGREIVAFLRAHAEREERLLFPDAKRRLPEDVAERVAKDFVRLDAERTGDASPASLEKLGRALAERYRAPASAPAPAVSASEP